MNVLIIDNNIDLDSWGSDDLRSQVIRTSGVNAYVRRGPHDDLPPSTKGYDRLIISGSKTSCLAQEPWIDHLDHLIREALQRGMPILGVCYGHQSLNRVLGGRSILRRGDHPEFGWSEIETLVPNSLFEGLPGKFYSYSSHWEEVAVLPRGMRHLARSKYCAIQACQLEDKPVFGIQFHPEKDLESCKRSLAAKKKDKNAPPLLLADESDRVFDEAVGNTIFGNFLKL